MLQLRNYQERSLDALAGYFEMAGQQGAKVPFVLATGLPYREVPQLPALPYVCLRIPTGGGKTFMACHAVGIAADNYLHADYPTVLWLAPSNAIVDQTLTALKNRQHPYRQELDRRFGGNVEVLTLKDALYVQRAVLDGAATIIVSTLQALRVDDTEGRKVYESAGALSNHFSGLSADQEARLERNDDGVYPHSLANVLRLRRPLVVMDEAHNARTRLSFDTLARFSPSAVIEFTATPETTHKPDRGLFASNVLHQVSARELKAAEMIKLPIRLRTRDDWKEVVAEAVAQQQALERIAAEEEAAGEAHLRPIVLLQAEQKGRPLTVEVVRQCLMNDFRIPEDQIAIATGQQREIDGVNLLVGDCPIRFIITMRALGEGWDCPFAYVLCSVAELGAARAVEQILGRVLRLPGAKRRQHEELNRAYAYVASQKFFETASSLRDALVENGFQTMEAADFVQPHEQGDLGFDPNSLFASATEPVTERPGLEDLPPNLERRVSYDGRAGTLTVTGVMSVPEMETLRDRFTKPEDKTAVETIYRRLGGQSPAGPRPPINVPKLAIRVDGQLELFEDQFLDTPWNLAQCNATLNEAEFPSEHSAGQAGDLDVTDAGQVEMVRFVEQVHDDLHRLIAEPAWTPEALANWLDRQIPHHDIPRAQSCLFMQKVLAGLTESRGVSIGQIAREKYRLARVVEKKIADHRAAHARTEFQKMLFGADSPVEVDPSFCFAIDEDDYAPNWYYEGGFPWRKHYFRHVGELKAEGEEFECARFIDGMDDLEWWIRNLDRRPDSSFWLQTATDRFYPDFVARLQDGRILVVESKGEHLWSNDDSKEKRAVGNLWADRSGGRCLFVMPKGRDWHAITAAVGGKR